MAAFTLDRVLTDAEALPTEEQELLEPRLRRRRIGTRRQETAPEAGNAIKAFRSGKFRSPSAENEEMGVMPLVQEDRLALVSPAHDVTNRSGKLHAQVARHQRLDPQSAPHRQAIKWTRL